MKKKKERENSQSDELEEIDNDRERFFFCIRHLHMMKDLPDGDYDNRDRQARTGQIREKNCVRGSTKGCAGRENGGTRSWPGRGRGASQH